MVAMCDAGIHRFEPVYMGKITSRIGVYLPHPMGCGECLKGMKMAEIDLQRKEQQSSAWLWVVLAIIIIGLVWWWIASRDNETAGAGAPNNGVASQTGAANPNLPLAAIAANPDSYFGQEVSGMASIIEVMSPNAFRIQQDGNSMFAYWPEAPTTGDTPAVGQSLSLTGTVRDPKNMQEYVTTGMLDDATLTTLQGEGAFLVVTNGELQDQNMGGAGGVVNEMGEAAGQAGETVTEGAREAGEAVTPGN